MEINRKAPVLASVTTRIAAPAPVVWEVLTDIRGWPAWNAAVSTVSMYGPFAAGTEFRWKADGVTIISQLQEISPHRRLLWTGRLPGVRAIHLWLFEERDGQTQVTTEECFEGWLSRLLAMPFNWMLARSLEKGLACLKQESERRHGGEDPDT